MDGIKCFNKDYFLLELQNVGAIKNKDEIDSASLLLKKVPNITIGLVLAARSLKTFENQIILSWVRKGRKLTALIEEQFDLYYKLSIYLQINVYLDDDFQEWKQILNSKYVFPADEKTGWSRIFGDTPIFLENVNSQEIFDLVQQHIKSLDTEDEEIKQKNEDETTKVKGEADETKTSISKVHFSHEYFASSLQKLGAITSSDIEKDIPLYLVKVPNITIGLVLAAKAVKFFTDEKILTWIRKGRKLTPLMEKQFLLYEQLSEYLKSYVEPEDVDKWESLINSKFNFPSSDNEGWSLVFGEIPELCQKIDKAQKSSERLENMHKEFEVDTEEEMKPSKPELVSNIFEVTHRYEIIESESRSDHNKATELLDNKTIKREENTTREDLAKSGTTKFSDSNSVVGSDQIAVNYCQKGEMFCSVDYSNEFKSDNEEEQSSLELFYDEIIVSVDDDTSDCDDDLDDIFNGVEAELIAIAEKDNENLQMRNCKVKSEGSDTLIPLEKYKKIQGQEITMETQSFSKEKSKEKILNVSEFSDSISESREEESDSMEEFEDTVLELEALDNLFDSDEESDDNKDLDGIDDIFDFVEAEHEVAEFETSANQGNPGSWYAYIAREYKNMFVDCSLSSTILNQPDPFAITGDSHGKRLVWAFGRLAETMSMVVGRNREALINEILPNTIQSFRYDVFSKLFNKVGGDLQYVLLEGKVDTFHLHGEYIQLIQQRRPRVIIMFIGSNDCDSEMVRDSILRNILSMFLVLSRRDGSIVYCLGIPGRQRFSNVLLDDYEFKKSWINRHLAQSLRNRYIRLPSWSNVSDFFDGVHLLAHHYDHLCKWVINWIFKDLSTLSSRPENLFIFTTHVGHTRDK